MSDKLIKQIKEEKFTIMTSKIRDYRFKVRTFKYKNLLEIIQLDCSKKKSIYLEKKDDQQNKK